MKDDVFKAVFQYNYKSYTRNPDDTSHQQVDSECYLYIQVNAVLSCHKILNVHVAEVYSAYRNFLGARVHFVSREIFLHNALKSKHFISFNAKPIK